MIADWRRPRLPTSGGALIKRGLPEGPVVARTLRLIEDRWVAAGFPAGEAFHEILEDALAAAH
jgi:poly(A) polymerase